MDAQQASADVQIFMGLAWRLQWNKRHWEVRVGQARLGEARKRFHDQDERFNDSNRGVAVTTTWAIGPIPHSSTPLQLSSALRSLSSWHAVEGDLIGGTSTKGGEKSRPDLVARCRKSTSNAGTHTAARFYQVKESEDRCVGQDQAAEGQAPRRDLP